MIKTLPDLDGFKKNTYVIASTRPWNRDMTMRLINKVGADFILISDPSDLTYENLKRLKPRFIFFPHWSFLISSQVFEEFECVIFHMTDLPYGRGGSPLQNLITRGIYETCISAIRCVKEVDAGPIYLKRALSLYGSAEEIFIRAADVMEDMILEIIEKLPEPRPQIGIPISFERRKPSDGNISELKSLVEAFDVIRMLDADGYPKAFLHIGNFKMEFSRASLRLGEVIADVRISLRDGLKEETKK